MTYQDLTASDATAGNAGASVPNPLARHLRRGRLARLASALLTVAPLLALGPSIGAHAAELVVDEGVVIRFGAGAQLLVRDKLTLAPSVTLSSDTDDSAGGQIGPIPQTPTAASWKGLRIEKSSQALAVTDLSSLAVRYAGAGGSAGVTVRGPLRLVNSAAPQWHALSLTDNAVGLRLLDGANPAIAGSSLLRNATGIETDGSAPIVGSSQLVGNTVLAIDNKTPATVVKATGNWWGHASGPNDPAANPQGQGDRVSTGVNYGQYLVFAPLIDCRIAPVAGYATSLATIDIALNCVNATQYRLSEAADLLGASFAPMAATASFTLSPDAGNKTLYAQFADAQGHSVTVSLPQPIAFTPGAPVVPTVTLTAPAAGASLVADTTISATATDAFGVAKVDFYVDGVLLATVGGASPYSALWKLAAVANGTHTIEAVATNTSAQTASDSRSVTVAKVLPSVDSVQLGGVALSSGATVAAPGLLVAQISAPGGLAGVSLAIDGTPVAGGSLSGSTYSAFLDFNATANGSHTITLTVTDKVGGVATSTINIQVAIPAPATPAILSPVNGVTVRQAVVSVSGTATPGTQVQVYVDAVAVGPLLPVNSGGNFSGSVNLGTEGSHALTAVSIGGHGTSGAGAAVQVVYAIASPTVSITSPSAGATLSAATDINVSVTDATGIAGVAIAIDGTTVGTLSAPPYTYHWDVTAAADGAHTLAATATNTAGKTGQASRTVTVQNLPPPPPPIVTPYTGSVASISPASSYGERPIVITGSAVDRSGGQPVANVSLKVVLQVAGFRRNINVATDAAGSFTYTFVPQASDSGTYVVSAIHPLETALTNQGQFVIDRLSFTPTVANVSAARGFAQPFQITAIASAGSGAAGVHFALNAEDQPSGSLPAGIAIDTGGTVNVPAGGRAAVNVSLTAGTAAAPSGNLVLTAYASGSGGAKRGTVTVNYRLYDATPALFATPTFIETGVSQGGNVTETLTVENKGLIAAQGLTAQLLNSDGSAGIPAWIYLASTGQLGNLDVGTKQTVQVTAGPGSGVTNGIYNFKLRVAAANATAGDIPVSVSVTQAGTGGMQFKVADIYTNTLDANGVAIPGLAGATIKVQNTDVLTVQQSAVSDASGVATFASLPTGSYVYRASKANHSDASGRFQVKPSVTGMQNVFLDYNLVNVEFSVTETTIQDRYDVVVTATYQTQVPAPVVLIEPMAINLPDMQVGEELTGAFTITNYGLVRADNVAFRPPVSDEYYRYEVLGTVPTSLEAKQRITLPYKVTNLKTLPGLTPSTTQRATLRLMKTAAASSGAKMGTTFAGSGCGSYSVGYDVSCDYQCAAGETRSCGSGGSIGKVYGGSCGGGGSAGIWGSGGGGGGGWGSRGGGGSSGPMPLSPQCAPPCCEACGCSPSGAGAGGS